VIVWITGCSSSVLPDPTDLEANNFTQADTAGKPVMLSDLRIRTSKYIFTR
jgi:hypothetical protein